MSIVAPYAGYAGYAGARPVARDVAWALLLAAAALAIRLHAIGGESLWVDEAASLVFAQVPWSTLWLTLPLTETNPPGYYAILKLSIEAFGISEATVRLPSALASALCVVPLYFLALHAHGRRAAVLAAALLALSGIQIEYGQEARAYAMVTLAFLLALWTGGRIAAARAAGQPMRWGWFAAFVASCAALPYLHSTAYLTVAAAYVFILAAALPAGALRPALVRDLALAGVAVLILTAPALYWIWVHMTAESTLVDWIPQPDLRSAYITYRKVFGHDFLPHTAKLRDGAGALQWLASPRTLSDGLLAVICAAGVLQALRTRTWEVIAALVTIGFVIATFFLISQIRPILLPRVVLFASPLVLLIAAVALTSIRPARLAAGAAALLLAVQAAGTYRYFQTPQKEDWRSGIASAAALHQPGMPVLLLAGELAGPQLIRLYGGDFAGGLETVTVIDAQPPVFPFLRSGPPEMVRIAPDDLCRAFDAAERLLVIERQTPRMTHEELRARLRVAGAVPLEEQRYGHHVVIELWAAPSCPR